jgi:hypothetical protein
MPFLGSLLRAASSGGGASPTFTFDPTELDIGTASSGTVEVTSDQDVSGFSVTLSGTIAAAASISTPQGNGLGACGDGVGDGCTLTLTRTGGTPGADYSGTVTLVDSNGEETTLAVALSVPGVIVQSALVQGAWNWLFGYGDHGETEQQNLDFEDGTLDLTNAAQASSILGAEGEFVITNHETQRGTISEAVTWTLPCAFFIAFKLNSVDNPIAHAIFTGGGNSGSNLAWLILEGGNFHLMGGSGPALVATLGAASAGTWFFMASYDALGAVTTFLKKVGSEAVIGSGTRGAVGSVPQTVRVGGDGAVYYSKTATHVAVGIRLTGVMTTEDALELALLLG